MGKFLVIPFIALASAAWGQATFSRVYKVGVTQTYTITQKVQMLGEHTLSIDLSLTPVRLLEGGKTEVKVHWANMQKSDANDHTEMPSDFTVRLDARGMPENLMPEQRSISYLVAMLSIAGATTGKPVTVGQEAPVSWDPGNTTIAFKGTVKVLEAMPDKNRLTTVVKIIPSFGGHEAGEMVFNSVIDTTDYSLITSSGNFSVAKQEFTFTRKKA